MLVEEPDYKQMVANGELQKAAVVYSVLRKCTIKQASDEMFKLFDEQMRQSK